MENPRAVSRFHAMRRIVIAKTLYNRYIEKRETALLPVFKR